MNEEKTTPINPTVPPLSPETQKSELQQDLSTAKEPELTMTEIREKIPLTDYRWYFEFATDSPMYFIDRLTGEQDMKKQTWHYVPRQINEEFRNEYGGKRVLMEVYCKDDLPARKRLARIIRKYAGSTPINWVPVEPNSDTNATTEKK